MIDKISAFRVNSRFLKKTTTPTSFTGLGKLEASFISDSEVRIPNLLDIKKNISISTKDMPDNKKSLNAAGLNVNIFSTEKSTTYKITNNKNHTIAVAEFNKHATHFPVVTYKQGKFMPEITIKDRSLDGKSIKMMAGSEIKAKDFRIVMPGQYEPMPGNGYKTLSFTGKVSIITKDKEPRVYEAAQAYNKFNMQDEAIAGDYISLIKKHNPSVVICADGQYDRFKNITRDFESKASSKMPTDQNYRIIANSLNLAASAGILNGDQTDRIDYLSTTSQIPLSESVYWLSDVEKSGNAIAQGLLRDIIPLHKDLILLDSNIFTNADITRAYSALKKLPNAALVIPVCSYNSENAKGINLIGVESDKNNNLLVKKIIQNADYLDDAPDPNDFSCEEDYDSAMNLYNDSQSAINPKDKNMFLVDSGMYFLSKDALKLLMAIGIQNPDKRDVKNTLIPKIIDFINEGKLLDKDGNPLKAYVVPLQRKGGGNAIWDDFATAESYLRIVKDIAFNTSKFGIEQKNPYWGLPEFLLEDFKRNTDLISGIVYDSQDAKYALENFKTEYKVDEVKGNIYISGR